MLKTYPDESRIKPIVFYRGFDNPEIQALVKAISGTPSRFVKVLITESEGSFKAGMTVRLPYKFGMDLVHRYKAKRVFKKAV